jgi:hypothetical protein
MIVNIFLPPYALGVILKECIDGYSARINHHQGKHCGKRYKWKYKIRTFDVLERMAAVGRQAKLFIVCKFENRNLTKIA